jgi:hypothetical protein
MLHMLFLNWGNEGNRQRIRDGNGWDDANVMKALGKLSKEEATFLQGVLETVGSLRPELERVHMERTGLPMGKVEPSPIHLNGETYAGGYFPLKADSRFFSKAGVYQEADVMKALLPADYATPYVRAGHRKARQEGATYPVDLNWNVVPAHMAQVIHDISYGDWVRQAGRILFDNRWKELTQNYLGTERASTFVPWLRDVANDRASSTAGAADALLTRAGGVLRSRLATGAMALNLPSLAAHTLDPLNAVAAGVGLPQVAASYVKVLTPFSGVRERAMSLSPELQYRAASFHDNLRKEFQRIGPQGGGVRQAINETLFGLHELLDSFTTKVTWDAGFNTALSKGLDQENAIRHADDAVRRAFPSHDIAEKPAILRSKTGVASALMFYGYARASTPASRRARPQCSGLAPLAPGRVSSLAGGQRTTTPTRSGGFASSSSSPSTPCPG